MRVRSTHEIGGLMGEPTASIGALKAVLDAAERLGLSKQDLLDSIAMDGKNLDDKDGRIPLSHIAVVDCVIRDQLGASSAIRTAETMARHHVSVAAFVYENSRTLGEFFRHVCRYRMINVEVSPPELEIDGSHATFGCAYDPAIVEKMAITIEKDLAFWLAKSRHVSNVDWTPHEVRLQGPETDRVEYERFFRATVRNNAVSTSLVFDAEVLDLPIPDRDPDLMSLVQPIAEEVLKGLSKRHGFVNRVQSVIVRLFEKGHLQIDDVASELAVSPRTLQRRLKSEGTTFGELLDEARRTAALEYLKDPGIAVTEAAFLLGFSEPSTFYRAFKRWTGDTPGNYRRRLMAV